MGGYHEGPSTLYCLTGVLIHIGEEANTGHYISQVKHGKDLFSCNDEVITWLAERVDPQSSQSAYMLVYTKKEELENSQKQPKQSPAPSSDPLTKDSDINTVCANTGRQPACCWTRARSLEVTVTVELVSRQFPLRINT